LNLREHTSPKRERGKWTHAVEQSRLLSLALHTWHARTRAAQKNLRGPDSFVFSICSLIPLLLSDHCGQRIVNSTAADLPHVQFQLRHIFGLTTIAAVAAALVAARGPGTVVACIGICIAWLNWCGAFRGPGVHAGSRRVVAAAKQIREGQTIFSRF
jgi:hypothetical protein